MDAHSSQHPSSCITMDAADSTHQHRLIWSSCSIVQKQEYSTQHIDAFKATAVSEGHVDPGPNLVGSLHLTGSSSSDTGMDSQSSAESARHARVESGFDRVIESGGPSLTEGQEAEEGAATRRRLLRVRMDDGSMAAKGQLLKHASHMSLLHFELIMLLLLGVSLPVVYWRKIRIRHL